MRIAITGSGGNGKTTLAGELAERYGLRHVELDALHHEPNWVSRGPEVLRERVVAATEGDDWVADGMYHGMLGNLVPERADMIVWLDLPVRLTLWRLVRRTYRRRRDKTVLWNGNVEPGWRDSTRYLIWPSLTGAFRNRRVLPARYEHFDVVRLRSDREVREFVQSIQATSTMSGSSGSSERQKTPPLAET